MRPGEMSIYRTNMIRLVFGFILSSLLFRYSNHSLLHQLLQPVIFKNDGDFTYWLYHILGLGKLIVQNSAGALIFDCLLVLSCLVTLIYPLQKISVIVFSLLYPLYFLGYNSFVGHHSGPMIGILFISFAFWAGKENTFLLIWQALRYYTILVYVSAFCWKVFVGASVFDSREAAAIVKENLGLYLYQNADTVFAHILYWFFQHPLILYAGYCLAVLAQGAMVIGLFTKKYDRYIGWLPVFFHLSTYFFVDVCFFELLILNFTFIGSNTFSRFLSLFKRKLKLVNTPTV